MKTEITFEELKSELLAKAKLANACNDGYRKADKATNESELLKVIFEYLDWCINAKIISHEYFAKFDKVTFLESGIANTGKENTGFTNSGYSNSGYRNSGDRNSGYRNSGYSNSGYSNSGYRNSGYSNSGYCNSGYSNSGYRNSGYSNSGDSNSGNWNSGNWNSGDRNSGDSNSGYRNSGAFCTDKNPTLFLFNKPAKMTIKEWENSRAFNLMYSIEPTVWIPWNAMSEDEKKANPKYEASEGYCKSIPLKDAWKNTWGNWSDENKNIFTSIENFDAAIFEEITGIKI